MECDSFKEVWSEISRWEFETNLIAFATYKALHLGTLTRERSSWLWTDDQMTRRLLKQYPQLDEQEVRTEIANWKLGKAEWIEVFLKQADNHHRPGQGSNHQCCISKIKGFQHISSSMATHWRHHPDLEHCMTAIHDLVIRREDKRLKDAAVSPKKPSRRRSAAASD